MLTFSITVAPSLPPPSGMRFRPQNGRYIFLTLETNTQGRMRGRTNVRSNPYGINIASLFDSRPAPRISAPRPRLNIQNTNITVRRPTVGLTVRTTNATLNFNLSGIGSGTGISAYGGRAGVNVVVSAYGIPTTIGGAAAMAANAFGIPTALPPLNEALNTLGIPTNIKVNIGDLGLNFPKIPEFPGLDMAGLYLGAGPKFIGEQIAKYKSIIPPFVPGLKIDMGTALAAMSVIRALMKSNPSDLLKHLLSQVVDDIAGQVMDQVNDAIDQTGINERIGQVKDQVGGVLNGAQIQFEVDFTRNNPPQTTYDENGNVIEIRAETPNSGIPRVDEVIPEKPAVQISLGVNASAFSSQNSQQRAYTYPPNNQ